MAVQAFAKPSGSMPPSGRKAASTGTGREAGVTAVMDMPRAPSLEFRPLPAYLSRMIPASPSTDLHNAPRISLSMGDPPYAPVHASQAETAAVTARTRHASRPFIMEVIPVAAPARPGTTSCGLAARCASLMMAGAIDMVTPCRERMRARAGLQEARQEGGASSGRSVSPHQQSQNQIGRM